MTVSYCAFGLEVCPPPGSSKGEYEAAHSALNDCLTGCIDHQTNDNSGEDRWRECTLLCDNSSYLDLIQTPTIT